MSIRKGNLVLAAKGVIKVDDAEFLKNVSYDSANKKLQKTIGSETTDVVTFGVNAFTDTVIPTITATAGSESITDGTNTLNFGSNAFTSTTIPTIPTTTTAGKVLKSTSTAGTVEWGTSELATPKIVVATSGSVSQALDPNKYYEFTGTLSALSLTLNTPVSGIQNVYSVRFYSGSTAPTITITPYSGSLRWTTIKPTVLNTYTYYELTIRDNVAELVYSCDTTPLYTTVKLTNSSVEGVGGEVSVVDTTSSDVMTNSLFVGHTYRIVATADTNYTVDHITLDGTTVANSSTFTADAFSKTIEVYFVGDETTLTYNSPTGATVVVKKGSSSGATINSGDTVRVRDDIYISITAASGYTVSKTLNGLTNANILSSASTDYYVSDVNPSITVTATGNPTIIST